jgi:hypothetical protein
MDTPNDRLKGIREKRGFGSAREAARAYGWPIDAYASHENGNRGIPPDAAIKYARAFQFSLDWLYKGTISGENLGINTHPRIAFKIVPRLLWNFLQLFGGVEAAMEQASDFASLPQTLEIVMPAFAMKVQGDSMRNTPGASPSFDPGEDVIFTTNFRVTPGDFVLAEIFDDNTVIFRQYRERGKNADGFMMYELAPLNHAYPTRLVTSASQARIVAIMTHSIKSYR